ncbi:MAG: cytochrome P450 [Ktedonobacteraceae bacterium]|nr:cytochrome P450 [Ktedonobacteraceae bacterium]
MTVYDPYHPFNPEHQKHLYEHMAVTRQQCPVDHVRMQGPTPFFFISHDQDVREVLERKDGSISNAGNFELEGATNKTVAQLDGEPHMRVRNALRDALNVRRYREITPYIEQKTRQLIDAIEARAAQSGQRQADLVQELTAPLPSYVLFHLIGIPEENVPQFRGWIQEIVNIMPAPMWGMPAWKSFSAFIDKLVAERREQPQDDLLTRLIQNPAIGAAETQMHIFQLMIAGADTTTQFAGSLIYRLLERREERWEQLLQQPKMISGTIEEGLRYDPPVIWLMRTAEKPLQLGGVDIPAGSRLIVGLSSANRDETVWTDPDAFLLNRAGAGRHVSFGDGVHFCLGAELARKQSNLLLSILLERMPTLRLVEGFEYRDIPSPIFRGPITLPVIW